MPQIRVTSLALMFLLLLSIMIAGCGSSNSQANFDSVTGRHPANWLPNGHKAAAKANLETCTQCHGVDYSGGVSQVSCTDCHIGNQLSVHPAQWGPFAYLLHDNYVGMNGTASCANGNCHGTSLEGILQSGPSCSSCHIGGPTSKHPAGWSNDYRLHQSYVTANGNVSCSLMVCHGSEMKAVYNSGEGDVCYSCH